MSDEKDNWGRADRLNEWVREDGVMIMGYDMFRNLTNEVGKKFKKKQKEIYQKALVDPGPDLVVCDEGHVLKNLKSALNEAMNKIKTLRRIILTGTPLQNNLSEYFAMVNFVKPNLLGTFNEFKNRRVARRSSPTLMNRSGRTKRRRRRMTTTILSTTPTTRRFKS